MTIEWKIEVQTDAGSRFKTVTVKTVTGTKLHVAAYRALVGYPLPALGETVTLRIHRGRRVPGKGPRAPEKR